MKKVNLGAVLVLAAGASAYGQMLYTNGPFATGATAQSGAPAPAGTQWSEVMNDTGNLTVANTTAGWRALPGTDRVADDFTVPAGQTWNVTGFKLYGYQTGSSTTSTYTGVTLRILNGAPPGGTVVFGDTTTNRMSTTAFSNIYRTFNTVVPPACGGAPTAAATNRPIMEINANAVVSLPAGTYYVDWVATGTGASGPWVPGTAVVGTRQPSPTANGLQSVTNGATYVVIMDAGQGCGPTPLAQDFPFEVMGSQGGTCYPDCDGDNVLTLADFGCFQTAFAGGNMYADCDGDNQLTLADFGCFQTSFAQGCP